MKTVEAKRLLILSMLGLFSNAFAALPPLSQEELAEASTIVTGSVRSIAWRKVVVSKCLWDDEALITVQLDVPAKSTDDSSRRDRRYDYFRGYLRRGNCVVNPVGRAGTTGLATLKVNDRVKIYADQRPDGLSYIKEPNGMELLK